MDLGGRVWLCSFFLSSRATKWPPHAAQHRSNFHRDEKLDNAAPSFRLDRLTTSRLTFMVEVNGSIKVNWFRMGENQQRRNSFLRGADCKATQNKRRTAPRIGAKQAKANRGEPSRHG